MTVTRKTRRLDVEELEPRVTPAAVTTLSFQIPAHVADMGVQAGIYGQQPPATPGGNVTTWLYLDSTFNYQSVPAAGGTLPLITLAAAAPPGSPRSSPVTATVPIPSDPGLLSGAVVMFVGPNNGIIVNPKPSSGPLVTGTVATPTVATNPNDIFSLFELNYSGPGGGLDVDLSEVDQVGFPYTVSFSPASTAPYPLGQAGLTPDRTGLFQQYQKTFSAQNTEFLESLTLGQGKRLVAPQTILANVQAPPAPAASPNTTVKGKLDSSRYYYYVVTESTATGETPQSPTSFAGYLNPPSQTGQTSVNIVLPTTPKNPQATAYNIYRVDRPGNGFGGTTTPYPTTGFGFLEQVPISSITPGTPIVDDGSTTPDYRRTPPTSAYGFDPLSTYFTTALAQFFGHYKEGGGNTLVLDQAPQVQGQSVGTRWKGSVKADAAGCTMLELTGGFLPGQTTAEFHDAVVDVYLPFFTTNVRGPGFADLKPMPAWLQDYIGNNTESPSQMVFGCDGVFATGTIDPAVTSQLGAYPGLDTALNQIENVLVSGFNRGLATSYKFALGPNQWVASSSFSPMAFTADPAGQQVAGGTLTPGATYYYVVTTVDAEGNETAPTREVKGTLTSTRNVMRLAWGPLSDTDAVAKYRVYRGAAPGAETLIGEVTNTGTETGYTDGDPTSPPLSSGVAPPYRFYSAGVASNLYSRFLHQNSTTDPQTGVSINGLVYGYPFDDQGSFSTNVQFPDGVFPTTVDISVNPFDLSKLLLLQAPPDAKAGNPASVTVTAETGTTVHFTSSDGQAVLPSDYTFVNADNGQHTFAVTLKTAGEQTLTVSAPQKSLTSSAKVRVSAAEAEQLAFAEPPRYTLLGAPLRLLVQARDACGNVATGARGSVLLTGRGVPPGTRAALIDGQAIFRLVPRVYGDVILTATSAVGTPATLHLSVADTARLSVSGPGRVTAGQAITLTVTARLLGGGDRHTVPRHRRRIPRRAPGRHRRRSERRGGVPADAAESRPGRAHVPRQRHQPHRRREGGHRRRRCRPSLPRVGPLGVQLCRRPRASRCHGGGRLRQPGADVRGRRQLPQQRPRGHAAGTRRLPPGGWRHAGGHGHLPDGGRSVADRHRGARDGDAAGHQRLPAGGERGGPRQCGAGSADRLPVRRRGWHRAAGRAVPLPSELGRRHVGRGGRGAGQPAPPAHLRQGRHPHRARDGVGRRGTDGLNFRARVSHPGAARR